FILAMMWRNLISRILDYRVAAGAALFLLLSTPLLCQSSQELIKAGQSALDRDDFATAVAAFERAHQSSPDNVQAVRGLMLSYLQSGLPEKAVPLGTESISHWPGDAKIRHWLGLAFFKLQQVQS